MNTSYGSLVALLSVFAERDDMVVWIRTPDYRQQLYVSPAFTTIWGRPPSCLFDDPQCWTSFLVMDGRSEKIAELCARNPLSPLNNRKTTYYRINNPKKGIRYIRDTCFYIYDSLESIIAIAGIAVDLCQSVWEVELDQIGKSENKEEQKIVQALTRNTGDDILFTKPDTLPKYYVFLRNGDHVGLSSREISCLKYSLEGLTAKMIARKLGIDHRTIEDYIGNLKRKLGCKSKGEIFKVIHPSTLDLLLTSIIDE